MKNIFKGIFFDLILYFLALVYILVTKNIRAAEWLILILILLALFLWLAAKKQLAANFSLFRDAKYLVKDGLYKHIRHPIYLFTTIANLGIAYLINNIYVYSYVIGLALVQFIRLKIEEKMLFKTFKEDYLRYKKQTWF